MTRDVLLKHIATLDVAARVVDWRAHAEIGAPATEAELRDCENLLQVVMPIAYRNTLKEWNGCTVELCEAPAGDGERGRVRVQWFISEIRAIVAATQNVREEMADAMAGRDVAAQVAEMMARIMVIVDQDRACIFIPYAGSELAVGAMKLEWALGQYPPVPKMIASSPDEYFEKSFRHLAETLETDLYWW